MIVALEQDDQILIMSDSRAISMIAGYEDNEAPKLWQLGDMPIVWGVFGNARVGMVLKAWLEEHNRELETDSWLEFREIVSGQAQRFNEETEVEMNAEFEGQPQQTIFYFNKASFLFAGYVGGQGKVLTVQSGGTSSFASHNPQVLANAHGPAALNAALAALRHERGGAFTLDKETLLTAFEAVGSALDGVGGATQIWRATPNGAEKLQ